MRGRLVVACERVYAFALLALPRGLRGAHGAEARETFRDACRDAAVLGRSALVGVLVRGVADALVQGVAERWRELRDPYPADGGRATRSGGWSMQAREWVHAARALRRAPTFSLVCLATFALVVGAAAAVFGAVDAVLLRPLPYASPERVLFIGESVGASGGRPEVSSALALNRIAAQAQTLEDVALFNIWEATLTEVGEPTRLTGGVATWNYFRVLGRQALLGRTFEEGEDAPGGPLRVVISHRLWRERFSGDPGIVGRTVRLSGTPAEVIGVMPADFSAPDDYIFGRLDSDIWRAGRFGDDGVGFRWLRAVGRMRDGAGVEQVTAELDGIRVAIGEQYPDWAETQRLTAAPLRAHVTEAVRPVLLLLAATAMLVLLVGCANLTNLLLARGVGRSLETDVRAALGAGPIGAVRPLVLEVVLLGIAGAALGLGLAWIGLRVLVASAPPGLPRLDTIAIDGRVMAAAFSAGLLVALGASLVPALRLAPRTGSPRIARGTRGSTGTRAHHRTQSGFAVAQLALALAVLSGAALLGRSFVRLAAVEPGFRPEGVYVVQMGLPRARYPDAESVRRFAERLEAELAASPALDGAGFVTSAPQFDLNNFTIHIPVAGREPGPEEPWAHYRGITPGYVATMGIPVRRGRDLDDRDLVNGRARAALVNEDFARRFLHDDPLGTTIVVQEDTVSVVGVVGNVRYGWLGAEDAPEVYVPYDGDFSTVFLVARAARDDAAATADIRERVRTLDPLLPVDRMMSEQQLLRESMAETRFSLLLLGTLGAAAVVLAALGLYGVIAHAVSERIPEFGLRLALGAPTGRVMALVMARGLRIAGAGALLGLLLALAGGRLLEGLLFGVGARDPLTLFGAAALLVTVALVACYRPARHAVRVDPAVALRGDQAP